MALWPKLSKKDAHNNDSVQLKVFNLLQRRGPTGGRCCRKNERVANYSRNKFMMAYAVSYMKLRFARFGCHLSVISVYQSLHNTWLGGCYKWVLSQMPTPSFWWTPSQKAICGHRSSLMQLCRDCFKDGSQQMLRPPRNLKHFFNDVDAKMMRPRVDQRAEILTTYNTTLQYLLKPLLKTVQQSLGQRWVTDKAEEDETWLRLFDWPQRTARLRKFLS